MKIDRSRFELCSLFAAANYKEQSRKNKVQSSYKFMLPASVNAAFIAQASVFLVSEYLPKIERCLEQLDDNQIWWRSNPQSNSIGNLILHLCGNARQWIVSGLGNETEKRHRDGEFAQTEIIEREKLQTLLRETVGDVARVLSEIDSDSLLDKRTIQGSEVDGLHAIFHVTEHFSMHTGQIIMLTKMLTSRDLKFYDFDDGAPVHRWESRIV